MLEPLERRRLLAAAAVSVVAGKLTITGTAGADDVSVSKSGSNLIVTVVGGVTRSFAGSAVTSILMTGGKGNDHLAIADTVTVKATLQGNDGDDSLRGGGGKDLLSGGGGNDTLDGGKGGDLFHGDAGTDTADYSARTNAITIGIGNLYDDGEKGEKDNIQWDVEVIVGGSGDDSIKASNAANTLVGNDGNDTLTAQLGDDLLEGGAGNDMLNGKGDADTLIGGDGDDSLTGGDGGDVIDGGVGNDTLTGGESAATTLLSDNDLLLGGDGDDAISGGDGDDTAIGGTGNDTISGAKGDDQLSGEEGFDSITGGDGNDSVTGGLDDDTTDGGDGIDTVSGQNGNDLITDQGVFVPDPTSSSSIGNPASETPPAMLSGGSGDDTIVGGDGATLISGDDGNDSIVGGMGNDVLSGGLGDDYIQGNAGRDTIQGGANDDMLLGGDDNDVFVNNDGEADTIDGGDGIDIGQVEEGLVDRFSNTEGRFDQPEDQIIIDPSDPTRVDTAPSSVAGVIVEPPSALMPAPTLVAGLLRIAGFTTASGGAVADVVQVTQSATTINVTHNAQSSSFPVGSVTKISIDVGGGNDVVILELSKGGSSVTRPTTIAGGSGNDTLRGGSGNDIIAGGTGNDSVTGGAGNDVLSGGDGNDILVGGSPVLFTKDGKDTFQGGKGAGDYADYSFRSDNLTLTLDGLPNDGAPGEGDQIGNDCEYVIGGRGNDLIKGNANANFLAGGGGSDTLKGGGGNDQLIANYTKDAKVDNVFGNSGFDYLFLEDKVQDNYNGTLGTDFFRVESNPNTGQPLDVLVPDQS